MAAARAGYKIAAFDIFNDADTRRFCMCGEALPFSNGSFDAAALLSRLDEISSDGMLGVAYGSGLEKQPAVLEQISSRFKLLGNAPEVLTLLKRPQQFFALLDELAIPYPEVSHDKPTDGFPWLIKAGGGSGGTHIRLGGTLDDGDYFQRQIQGLPVSVLFLADGKCVQVIGYNEQWLAPAADMPYRFGGAVSQIALSQEVCQQMLCWAEQLTRATGLRGINSMDCLLTEQGLVVLEINPRLSATMGLYDIPDLFERHLQACEGNLSPLPVTEPQSVAQQIVYATHPVAIEDAVIWPDWVVDRPAPGSLLQQGQPVCSVLASAADAGSAKQLVFARVHQIEAQLRP